MKINFRWNRRKKTDGRGRAPVELRIYINGLERYVNTGILLKAGQWNGKVQRSKDHPEAAAINLRLSDLENRAFRFYHSRLSEGLPLSAGSVKDFLEGNIQRPEELISFIEDMIRMNPKGLSEGTLKQRRTMVAYLRDFRRQIPFSEVDGYFVTAFEGYLRKFEDNYGAGSRTRGAKKLSGNYISSLLSILKIYTGEAMRQGIIRADPFIGIRIQKTKSERTYLTMEEIKAFSRVTMPGRRARFEESMDKFLFCAYTGLRYSDLIDLKGKHIKTSIGGLRLVKKPLKTKRVGTTINLPLYSLFWGRPEAIVKKWMEGKRPKDSLAPGLDLSTYNNHLNEIAQAAGIRKRVTSHAARHTFAMILLNDFRFPVEYVRRLMGHSDISTTEVYAKLTDQSLDRLIDSAFE